MKRIIHRALAITGAAFLMAGSAAAQSSTLDKAANILERQARAGRGEFITYLVGAAAAYRWVTKDGKVEASSLYCPPSDIKLDGRSWGKIALEEYRRDKSQYAELKEYPLNVFALALLHGLQSKYPCAAETTAQPSPAAGTTEPSPAAGK